MSDLSFTDVGNLRAEHLTDAQRLQRVAAQFEGQFLQILLRESKGTFDDESGDAIFGDSPAVAQFQDLLHGALVERGAGGTGIADLLVRHLGGADHDRP